MDVPDVQMTVLHLLSVRSLNSGGTDHRLTAGLGIGAVMLER